MTTEALNPWELCYKRLYQQIPAAWNEPISTWQEMVARAHSLGVWDIPEQPPSYMDSYMEENGFFLAEGVEVQCFLHARYCPPFVHRLAFLKMVYALSGNVTIYLQNRRYQLSPGNFCIIPPDVEHTVFSCADEDCTVNVLVRSSSFAHAFSGLLMEQNILSDFFWKCLYTNYNPTILFFGCPSDPRLDRFIRRMLLDSSAESRPGNLMMKHYLMVFLAIAIRDHFHDLRHIDVPLESIYQMPAIVRYIETHLATVTAEDLQREFGMKEARLRHYVVQESGYHLSGLLRELRLTHAARLLRNTQQSVERIIEQVGYGNANLFYRQFRQKYGKTPHEYRDTCDTIL